MYYVYVLKSKVNGDLYIGYCENLHARFGQHNKGKVRSTKAYKPWVLVYYEAYLSKKDAAKRERKLKMHAVKEELKSRLKYSLG